jgi:hypothetical protein
MTPAEKKVENEAVNEIVISSETPEPAGGELAVKDVRTAIDKVLTSC